MSTFVDDEASVHEEAINAIAASAITAGDESGTRFVRVKRWA